jgi:type I restriction enzyme S subunit
MNTLKDHKNQVSLKELVTLVDHRNRKNQIGNLLGINVNKAFMPSKANVSSKNLHKYKIIQKDQFAYSAMQVGRDETVRVTLYDKAEPAIISPAYSVFEIEDTERILPEFLILWFYRSEFNRYGWFLSDSSVRSSLDWERFTQIEIPVPKMEVQKAIVTIYHTLQTRKRISERLQELLKPLCPVLMRGVVEEMEEEGKLEYEY